MIITLHPNIETHVLTCIVMFMLSDDPHLITIAKRDVFIYQRANKKINFSYAYTHIYYIFPLCKSKYNKTEVRISYLL